MAREIALKREKKRWIIEAQACIRTLQACSPAGRTTRTQPLSFVMQAVAQAEGLAQSAAHVNAGGGLSRALSSATFFHPAGPLPDQAAAWHGLEKGCTASIPGAVFGWEGTSKVRKSRGGSRRKTWLTSYDVREQLEQLSLQSSKNRASAYV
jgi:hypothetical protein